MLDVHLVAVLSVPIGRLLDLLLGHKITVGILNQRLVNDAGDVMGLCVHLEDFPVCGKLGRAVGPLGHKKLPQVGRLVHQGHELDFGVFDFSSFLYFSHALHLLSAMGA